jgi:hypothetical protein
MERGSSVFAVLCCVNVGGDRHTEFDGVLSGPPCLCEGDDPYHLDFNLDSLREPEGPVQYSRPAPTFPWLAR